jgi:anti-sigma B factor antagonist
MCRMSVPFVSDGRERALGSEAPAVVDLEYVQGCAVVAAAGELDLYAAPALRGVLTEAAESADRIIIDLTGVTFLDSAGMTVMVDALNLHHHRQRGTLCLVGLSRAEHQVLDITNLTSQFPIYPSLREAIAELA